MILKNSLYHITSKNDTVPAYAIMLQADHAIYRAHFPGQPVTPGVCIVQMAVELLSDHLGKPLQLVGAKNIKFMSVISPIETPCVTFIFDKILPQGDGTTKAQLTVSAGEAQLTKISMTCAEQGVAPACS